MDPSNALLALAGTNVLVALSLAFPLSCGVISLASAGFVGIGTYAALLLMGDGGWSWILAVPVGAMVALSVALPMSVLVARLPSAPASASTLAFTLVIGATLAGRPLTGTIDRSVIPGAVPWWLLLASLAAVTYLVLQARRSRFGQALFAIRADPTLAASLGIDVSLHKGLAFLLSAGIAGMAGAVAALLDVGASADWPASVSGMEAVVIGGIAACWGPWLGALALSFLPFVAQLALTWAGFGHASVPVASASLNQVASGVITLLVLLFAPGGVSGSMRRWRERRRTVAMAGAVVAPRAVVPPLAVVTGAAAIEATETAPLGHDADTRSSTEPDLPAEDTLTAEPPFRAAAS